MTIEDLKKAYIQGYKDSWEEERWGRSESYELDEAAESCWEEYKKGIIE